MGKTWVLDTETKGTGAHVVPLEKALQPLRDAQDLALVELQGPPRPARAPEPPAPLRFKVVDVMGARVLAEGVGARETVEVLEGMRSVLDAGIYLWVAKTGRWRMLTLDERKTLWRFRGRLGASQDASG
jgi:hypothetical protein